MTCYAKAPFDTLIPPSVTRRPISLQTATPLCRRARGHEGLHAFAVVWTESGYSAFIPAESIDLVLGEGSSR